MDSQSLNVYLEATKQKLAIRLRSGNEAVFDDVVFNNAYGLSFDQVLGKVVYDIGANRGMFSSFCSELGAKRVIAVEPVTKTFNRLKENIKPYPGVLLFNNAVTNVDGDELKIYQKDDSADSSACLFSKSDLFNTVTTISLDKLVEDYPPEGGILKLDCEGAEYEILLLSKDSSLKQFNTVCIEIHANLNPIYQGFELIEDRLKAVGFSMIKLDQLYLWPYPGAEGIPLASRVEKWVRNA